MKCKEFFIFLVLFLHICLQLFSFKTILTDSGRSYPVGLQRAKGSANVSDVVIHRLFN